MSSNPPPSPTGRGEREPGEATLHTVKAAERELHYAIEREGHPSGIPLRHISDAERQAIDRLVNAALESGYLGGLAVGRARAVPAPGAPDAKEIQRRLSEIKSEWDAMEPKPDQPGPSFLARQLAEWLAALPPAGGASERGANGALAAAAQALDAAAETFEQLGQWATAKWARKRAAEVRPAAPSSGPAVPAGTWTGEPLATLGRLYQNVKALTAVRFGCVSRFAVLALIDAEQTRASAGGEAGARERKAEESKSRVK